MNFRDTNTPAVLIDRDIVDRNIRRFQDYCRQNSLALRPHIKTRKLVELVRFQVAAGAVGIICQKLSEAEIMASQGLHVILITYNIIGENYLKRLVSLSAKVSKLTVTVDSLFTVQVTCPRWSPWEREQGEGLKGLSTASKY